VNPMEQVAIEFLADNPGNWFHPCHNLYHMEAGMAKVVTYSS
jgi:FtsP/CotA-like multicopper oxidase with cupredoxin domain